MKTAFLFKQARTLAVMAIAALYLISLSDAVAETPNWRMIDISGLLSDADEGAMPSDLWSGYTQEDALQTLSFFPDRLPSPGYKSAVRKFLVSRYEPFEGDIAAPRFLARRIMLLIQYGLYDDAAALYKTVLDEAQYDFDLSLAGLALTLARGDIAPACLDAQALSDRFANMPVWREIVSYCNIRFGGTERLGADRLAFQNLPLLSAMLAGPVAALPDSASVIEILMAYSDAGVDEEAYAALARDARVQADSVIAASIRDDYADRPAYLCYAIEAASRGILTKNQLADLYTARAFSDDLLAAGNESIQLHACDVPAYFYQRLAKGADPDDHFSVLFSVARTMPLHAFGPFADRLAEMESHDPSYKWTAGLILALYAETLPNHPAHYPLSKILNGESVDIRQAQEWKKYVETNQILSPQSYDLALPLHISLTNSLSYKNLTKNNAKSGYENFFSLTYAQNTLYFGLGYTDALFDALERENFPRALLIALSDSGRYRPSDVHPEVLKGIMASFDALKLENEKQIIAIEALHY